MNISLVIGCLVCIAVISANVIPPSLRCENEGYICSCCAAGNRYTPNYNDDCSTYWHSDGNRDQLRNCSVGLVFDITLCVCNFPANVRCELSECESDTATTIRPNITTTQPDDITTTRPDDITTTRPDDITTTRPDDITTTRPDDIATTRPDYNTTTRPDYNATARPDYNATARPENITSPSTPGCGGFITNRTNGTIQSPNHPADYHNNLRCTWIIEVAVNQSVSLMFEQFELETHPSCGFDYLELRDGNGLSSPVLARLCGAAIPESIQTESRYLTVSFVTDGSVTKAGFKAIFTQRDHEVTTALPIEDTTANPIQETTRPVNITTTRPVNITSPSTPGCGGFITNRTNGTIQSPNHPADYHNNLNCTWIIEVAVNQSVSLMFEQFELETHPSCGYDYLELRDGNGLWSPVLAKLCGAAIPELIQTESRYLTVSFVTDGSVTKAGFKGIFTQKKHEVTTALPIGETTAIPIQTTFELRNDSSAGNLTVFN